jgi:hypothetical protein
MILTDAFGAARKRGGGNASLDRVAIHTPKRDLKWESRKLATWGARRLFGGAEEMGVRVHFREKTLTLVLRTRRRSA